MIYNHSEFVDLQPNFAWTVVMIVLGLAHICFEFLLVTGLVNAALPDGRLNANQIPRPAVPRIRDVLNGAVTSRNGTHLPPYNTVYLFDQLIDHLNPGLGSFKQRFWHTYEFYELGGPIILSTPGEVNAAGYYGYLTNRTINGLIAQQQNGSTIVLEHRFYGLSNPYPDLSVESLRVHTIQQAIEDLVYFAENVVLPMPGGENLSPATTPWVLVGGSYSGALTSWTMVSKPNLFWAGYASSGVVEAITDFWRYFEPIRQHMPWNCSADVEVSIAHIDQVFSSDNQTAINSIKSVFGMDDLTHLDDMAGALRNNLWDWQSLSVTTGPGGAFYLFCDALEVKDGKNAPPSGWGLDHALSAWGSFWKNGYLDQVCAGLSVLACLGTYDPTQSFYTNTSIDNANRSWLWIVCNEVGYLQDGPPIGLPAIVTRLVQPIYDARQCQLMFPTAFVSPPVPKVARTNFRYKGWDVQTKRLFFANGRRDPWRDATVSADGLGKRSTHWQPIAISDGFHCSDLITRAGMDVTVAAVQQQALAAMMTWLAQWESPSKRFAETSGNPMGTSLGPGADGAPVAVAKPVNAFFKSFGEA